MRALRAALLSVAVMFTLVPAASAGAPPSGGFIGPKAATSHDYPWHTNIVATTFWVGELFNSKLSDGSQVCSTYDSKWALHWAGFSTGTVPKKADGCPGSPSGGCDGITGSKGTCKTEARKAPDFWPTKAKPRENPFYLDLPYDDINDAKAFKARCTDIPWAAGSSKCKDDTYSFMKNRWVHLIGASGRDCYGQIEDAGPSHGSLYHDAAYVFGSGDKRPAQREYNRAGADVSPALNGCLGFKDLDGDTDKVKWRFVEKVDVPDGPWLKVVTTSGVTP